MSGCSEYNGSYPDRSWDCTTCSGCGPSQDEPEMDMDEPGYYGVWAVRGASSIFGAAEAWCKDLDGEYMVLDSQEEAQKVADGYNQSRSPLASVRYCAKEMEPQLAEEIIQRREQGQEPEMGLSGPC